MALRTSPELLTDILGVLGAINTKLDKITAEGGKGSPGVGSIALGTYLGGRRSGKKDHGNIADLANSVEKLNKELSKVNTSKLDKMASLSKDATSALAYMGVAIVTFTAAFGLSKNVLGMSPWEVLGFIAATAGTLAVSMIIIAGGDTAGTWIGGDREGIKGGVFKQDRNRNKSAIQSAKDMGIALMFIAGGITSFSLSLIASAAILGTNVLGVAGIMVGTVLAIGISMAILSGVSSIGEKRMAGVGGKSKDAIENARNMGIALMFIAGGALAFAISVALIPRILGLKAGQEEGKFQNNAFTAVAGIGTILLTILAISGVFWLMGKGAANIGAGVAVAGMMALGMVALAAGVWIFAKVAQSITGMGDKNAVNKDKEPRGKFGQLFAGIGPGLGMMGIILVSTALLFAGLGFAAPLLLPGAGVAIAMSLALITIAGSIKKVNDTIKELGGKPGLEQTAENIRLMVFTVMSAVIEGVVGKGSKIDKSGDGNLSLDEVRQFRRVKRVIGMLGTIAKSISQFSQGLMAFSKVGQIASLDYDENGKPVIGKSVHVSQIASAIADTFGKFLTSLVTSTEGLTRKQARSMKILGKALTGERGLISAINQFSTALQTFAKFGKEGKIATIETLDDGTQKTGSATITDIVNNIVTGFGKFVQELVNRSSMFSEAGDLGRKMKTVSEVLMGSKKGLFGRRETPGILSAITDFSDLLVSYAEHSADGKIPLKDKDGNILPGQFTTYEAIVSNMFAGISTFMTHFSNKLSDASFNDNVKNVKKKIGNFTDIVTDFDKMAKSQDAIDKLANSMGLLATNVGLLVTNMGNLNTANLERLSAISAQHAVTTKGVTIPTSTSTPAASSAISSAALNQPNWDEFANKIGQIIADKISSLPNGEFQFRFYEENKGVLTVKK